jgi:hypothetical protein
MVIDAPARPGGKFDLGLPDDDRGRDCRRACFEYIPRPEGELPDWLPPTARSLDRERNG